MAIQSMGRAIFSSFGSKGRSSDLPHQALGFPVLLCISVMSTFLSTVISEQSESHGTHTIRPGFLLASGSGFAYWTRDLPAAEA